MTTAPMHVDTDDLIIGSGDTGRRDQSSGMRAFADLSARARRRGDQAH